MKKHLACWLIVIALPFFISAQQTYEWIASTGSWTDPTNWSPQRNTPAGTDILQFGVNAIVTQLPSTENVGKIRLYNNANVSFSSIGTSAITVGDALVTGPHLIVESGSIMNISGSNPISFQIAAGYSGQVSGSIDFSGAAHRLTAVSANALIFAGGSVFTANTGFTGNPFGATSLNSVIFQNGALYIRKAGGNPFGATAPDAVAVFNSGSIYRHQVNGTGPSLAGRIYGNLYIDANVSFSGIGSARDCIIQNDLAILSGYFVYKPNSGSHTGNFNIYGNIICESSAYIDIGSPNMLGGVQLLGNNQTIGNGGGTGSITLQHLTFNNSSTTLARDITVTGVMNMVSGKIITGTGAVLILAATASLQSCLHDYSLLPYTNIGCDNSYIEGPVRKLGLNNEDFAFPIGVNGKLRPAFLRNATGDFTVQFVRGDPNIDISTSMGAGIHHISHLEYWAITGSGNAKVEISYFDPNSGGVTDMNALRVARFDGSQWADQGVSSFLGTPGANGSITSNQVSQFGNFSLAGALGYPNNPLPYSLISFNASVEDDNISLNWVIPNAQAYKFFTIEKEQSSGTFQTITLIDYSHATGNQLHKTFDPNPNIGINRYRLKLTALNGNVIFSEISSVVFRGQPEIKVYPNPAREKIFIKIPKSSSISEIAIVHISGSVIKWLKTNNQTALNVDIRDLASGMYFVKIIQAGYFTVIPIVKY